MVGATVGTGRRAATDADVVATPSADGFQLHDMDSGTTTTIAPGAGQSYVGTFGSRVLTVTKAADGSVTAFHVLGVTGAGQAVDLLLRPWSGAWHITSSASRAVLGHASAVGHVLGTECQDAALPPRPVAVRAAR